MLGRVATLQSMISIMSALHRGESPPHHLQMARYRSPSAHAVGGVHRRMLTPA